VVPSLPWRRFAGTSGFACYLEASYPEKLRRRNTEHYATRLNVEINCVPSHADTATLAAWVDQTPRASLRDQSTPADHHSACATRGSDGVFFKAIDRCAAPVESARFFSTPNLKADHALLAEFLALLPTDLVHTFEFRHASWLTEETYSLLAKYNVALCLAESEKLEIPQVLTANYVYWRLRMPEYTAEDRVVIAGQAERWLAEGRDVYVFFKHEETPEGALYAQEILRAHREQPGDD
jgi:uncharacterized protein YecE (DUF72 family)